MEFLWHDVGKAVLPRANLIFVEGNGLCTTAANTLVRQEDHMLDSFFLHEAVYDKQSFAFCSV